MHVGPSADILRHIEVAPQQLLKSGAEAIMEKFEASFFKNLLSSNDGHLHKCLQKSLEVTGEDADDALVSAKNRRDDACTELEPSCGRGSYVYAIALHHSPR
jgi:hypothetical protein